MECLYFEVHYVTKCYSLQQIHSHIFLVKSRFLFPLNCRNALVHVGMPFENFLAMNEPTVFSVKMSVGSGVSKWKDVVPFLPIIRRFGVSPVVECGVLM